MAFGYRRVFWLLFGIASFFFYLSVHLHLGLLLNVFLFFFLFAHHGLDCFSIDALADTSVDDSFLPLMTLFSSDFHFCTSVFKSEI